MFVVPSSMSCLYCHRPGFLAAVLDSVGTSDSKLVRSRASQEDFNGFELRAVLAAALTHYRDPGKLLLA